MLERPSALRTFPLAQRSRGRGSIALICLIASTAATFLQVSSDPASASFARARLFPPNSGDISINTQAGSFYLSMVDVALAFPFVRFESNVFETASRSYVFVAKG